jgi:hypothetical protein
MTKKKHNPLIPHRYGKGQYCYINAAVRGKTSGKKYYWDLLKRHWSGHRLRMSSTISQAYGYSNSWSSYDYFPHHFPGDTVYVVEIYKNGTRKIVKDVVEEVMCYGHGKGVLKDYWLRDHGVGHGIEAGDIYKSYNEAQAALFY